MHAIRTMTPADYDAVLDLMRRTPGVALRDADSRAATLRYLDRNPDLSFVCSVDERLIGCVMCGHDGRRGYLQHLLVLPAYRGRGIGSALVTHCLDGLARLGIVKCHIDVLQDNDPAIAFWEKQGWQRRTDIHRYSFIRSGSPNA